LLLVAVLVNLDVRFRTLQAAFVFDPVTH
jgi:hypothetical protein